MIEGNYCEYGIEDFFVGDGVLWVDFIEYGGFYIVVVCYYFYLLIVKQQVGVFGFFLCYVVEYVVGVGIIDQCVYCGVWFEWMLWLYVLFVGEYVCYECIFD